MIATEVAARIANITGTIWHYGWLTARIKDLAWRVPPLAKTRMMTHARATVLAAPEAACSHATGSPAGQRRYWSPSRARSGYGQGDDCSADLLC